MGAAVGLLLYVVAAVAVPPLIAILLGLRLAIARRDQSVAAEPQTRSATAAEPLAWATMAASALLFGALAAALSFAASLAIFPFASMLPSGSVIQGVFAAPALEEALKGGAAFVAVFLAGQWRGGRFGRRSILEAALFAGAGFAIVEGAYDGFVVLAFSPGSIAAAWPAALSRGLVHVAASSLFGIEVVSRNEFEGRQHGPVMWGTVAAAWALAAGAHALGNLLALAPEASPPANSGLAVPLSLPFAFALGILVSIRIVRLSRPQQDPRNVAAKRL